ncbi:dephospho-CoA kinase [Helcococcus sueciensis]|uniref:dephospho-CoA kinase n=1 Tax=Helcococcus sueciensis TaxID=241555 RepID=UPI0004268961|nr:dephospho-CoA kinase [Helcococcus sueciensis]
MKSRIIGLTGSIATGKSTVSKYLIKKGYKVVDADKITHELMKKDNINYVEIVKHFGNSILDKDDEIDRKKLANIVFSDENKLNALNNLTHPNIFNKINETIEESDEKIIFLDIALLIEFIKNNIWNISLDEIWLVYVNKDIQLERLMKRNNFSEKEAKIRIKAQMDIDEKIKYSDFILYNDRDLEYLYKQIDERLNLYESN